MSSSRKQLLLGIKWTAFSQIIKILTQLLGLMAMAKILPPSDFGLMAMASIAIGFISLFKDLGTSSALIQQSELSQELTDSVFWFNIVLSLLFAALLLLVAPLLAIFFHEPKLTKVLWLLSLNFPLTGLSLVHQALLEKSSNFKPVAKLEASLTILGLLLAILLAKTGWGIYSLVLQTIFVSSAMSIGLWVVSNYKPKKRFQISHVRSIFNFSMNLTGFSVFNYLIRNGDNFLIGKYLGATDLGIYAMAYKLMTLPMQIISSILSRALYPVLSGMQSNHSLLKSAYLKSSLAFVLLVAPVMFGLYILRDPLVGVVLGRKWKPVIGLLVWLAPIGFMQCIGTTVGLIYMATGKTNLMLKWGLAASIPVLIAFVIGIQFGIIGVARAYFFASLLLFLPSLYIPFKIINLKIIELIKLILPTVISSLLMGLVLYLMLFTWPISSYGETFRLVILVTIGGLSYLTFCYIFQKAFLLEIYNTVLNREYA
jgi:O-antigen/teichoic acid export membrane protein